MVRATSGRLFRYATAVVVTLSLAAPALAQTTGTIRGKVTDAQNQPIENAKIVIEFKEGMNRKFETKTNKKGEYIQIGLTSGGYAVTAEKEGIGSQSFDVRLRQSQPAEVNFQLVPGQSAMTKADAAKLDALKAVFAAGVTASQAGNYDEAVTKFTEAAGTTPNCYDCYYNIGHAYTQKKDYAKAEEAYKKAIEMKADYGEAYQGLATVYNAQKKFDQAAAASAEAGKYMAATGGGSPDAIFNQGLILWNAGKIAEAKKQFEDAVKGNPNLAEAHYWLGMANLNEGKLPEAASEFETYVKLAPGGQYEAQAKGVLSQIKK